MPTNDIAHIIRSDFGRPGDTPARPYIRALRLAIFAAPPAAFPACIQLAQLARARGWRRLADWMRSHMERRFGCYVHPGARIGPGLRTPHPIGIVIGSGCRVGSGVTLYQHVTLGTNEQANYLAGVPSYPSIGDGVVLYAGAVVIGAIELGAKVVVGANAVVTRNVAGGCVAVGVPAVAKPPRGARGLDDALPSSAAALHAGQICPR